MQLSPGKQRREGGAAEAAHEAPTCIPLAEFQHPSQKNAAPAVAATQRNVRGDIRQTCEASAGIVRGCARAGSRGQQTADGIVANMTAELPGVINEGIKVTFSLLDKKKKKNYIELLFRLAR